MFDTTTFKTFLRSCSIISLKMSIAEVLLNLLNYLLFTVSAGNRTAKLRRGDGTK